jgi:lipoyl(octanoyl) transferase
MPGYWLDLGLMRYIPAFEIQEKVLKARMEGRLPSTLIFQESPKTFTIGRSGSHHNVLVSTDGLEREGIELVEASRGGDVTYHGPGQLIVSPLLYLGDLNINANQYMHCMEDVLIGVLADFDIQGFKRDEYPGVWVQEAKIGSVGIAVRHGFTFHGVSLNVTLDLSPFQLINPCGYVAMPVTSLEVIKRQKFPMNQVRESFLHSMEVVFDLHLQAVSLNEIELMLESK